MKNLEITVFKNATANVLRGIATAMVALALPHYLVRALSQDRFSAWSLMLQITACASYLDFGLQTAVARYVAQLMEVSDYRRVTRLVNTSIGMLAGAGGLALGLIGIVLWQLPILFHGIPATLFYEFRLAALLLAVSTCAQLPLSAYSGILTGLHRNEYPAVAIGGSRIAGGVAAIIAGVLSHSLIGVAACIGAANLLGGLIQLLVVHRLLPRLRLRLFTYFDRSTAAELARYCVGLTVWSFGVFLVSGTDLVIVGHFQFRAVGYYSVATALITCFVGFWAAIINAFMTPIAALHARGEVGQIRVFVVRATRWMLAMNAVLASAIFLFGEPALELWVGSSYAHPAFLILRILMVAQAIRSIGAAYCVMLIATGQQHHGIEGALVEGVVSLCASLGGAVLFGPVGVAAGTLIGTSCGLVWVLTRTMPRAQAVPFRRREFVMDGVLIPAVLCVPIAACMCVKTLRHKQLQRWASPLSDWVQRSTGSMF